MAPNFPNLLIVIIFDISEKIDDFLEHEVNVSAIIFDYYFNFIPYFGNLFSPLFIFISVIFFTSKMANDTEIIAFRGQDKKGRGIYLVLKTPKMGKETNKKRDRKNMSLVLSYFDDVKKRDVYEVKNKP